jgi:hypothetical protein
MDHIIVYNSDSRGIGRENLEEWILKRRDGISCLFYEWLVDPPDCILE